MFKFNFSGLGEGSESSSIDTGLNGVIDGERCAPPLPLSLKLPGTLNDFIKLQRTIIGDSSESLVKVVTLSVALNSDNDVENEEFEFHRWKAPSSSAFEIVTKYLSGNDAFEVSNTFSDGVDVIPHIYEGGERVWECTLDLLKLLNIRDSPLATVWKSNLSNEKDIRLLDCGCGHGFLGLYVLRRSMLNKQSRYSNISHVTLQDYNSQVLRSCTFPNSVIELGQQLPDLMNHDRLSFLAASWESMSFYAKSNNNLCYDVILASETIYRRDVLMDFVKLLQSRCLRANGGIAIIAGKRHYFGTCGGTDEFLRELNTDTCSFAFDCLIRQKFEDAKSNIREVIAIQKRPQN